MIRKSISEVDLVFLEMMHQICLQAFVLARAFHCTVVAGKKKSFQRVPDLQ